MICTLKKWVNQWIIINGFINKSGVKKEKSYWSRWQVFFFAGKKVMLMVNPNDKKKLPIQLFLKNNCVELLRYDLLLCCVCFI